MVSVLSRSPREASVNGEISKLKVLLYEQSIFDVAPIIDDQTT